jgi:hypothetical protein
VILAVAHDEFVGDSVGALRFLRNARAGMVGFTVSRDNARGVLFQRLKHGRADDVHPEVPSPKTPI